MSLPRRLEQVGIVGGSVLMLTLPFSFLWAVFFNGPGLVDNLLVYVPGLIVGVLVALRMLPVSYGQVWLFGIASWLATFSLWWVLGAADVTKNQPTLLVTWVLALLVGALVAWAKPKLRWRGNEA
ncbi:hypothetical protein [Haladaptatus sp. T7]|uniref:hypothetical protein n=1 Tax=Haladaptatus sp. T7 TaxID=2029368 RepID=UPI0021A25710|nr:hypothetical protein [Haladaptatus sp. T7]GKZ15123.1 hypothetical protein HAL_30040 [Haladaptatus sp. T7]